MKVKTIEELNYLSEELAIAYVKKCVAYFESKYEGVDPDTLSKEEQDEWEALMEVFRFSRINDLY